ncbi:hypothetical protein [Marinobacter subterrani]|uniref:hypothetical protein n=1 Tax=Marinobacter subterrani TaxID=1658765 RepID=UPI0023541D0E|nr:hypothetical protein [Marinobacter subterrani]
MGVFSWQCAKTHTSIPEPKSASNPEQHHVHLYLPEGQRIEGFLNGAGCIIVEEAYERDADGHESSVDDIEEAPWLMNAGGYLVDIFQAIGAQVIEGFGSREDAFRGDHFERIADHIKLVKHSAVDPTDRYEHLETSEPCPFQGVIAGTHNRIDHLYDGDARLAYITEFTYPLPGSPEHNNEAQCQEAMESATEFATDVLEPSELKAILENKLNLRQWVLEGGAGNRGTKNAGDDAGYSFEGDLLPCPCTTWTQTEVALLAAYQSPEFQPTLLAHTQNLDADEATLDCDSTGPTL